jgi:hydroxymethylglutaryl-CoA synthase
LADITGYCAYVPRYRLDRGEAAAATGDKGRGTRAVAAYDQDATTLGVEAALTLAGEPADLWFATTAPAYVDKTNATLLHAALGLAPEVPAYDLGASVRSGAAALRAAGRSGGLAVVADVRDGLTGSADERTGGDAAAAFSFAPGTPLATLLGTAGASAEFLDRWRLPGELGSSTWEERFGQGEYARLAALAVDDVLKAADVPAADVDAVAVAGPHARALKAVTASLVKQTGGRADTLDLQDLVGNAGAAHLGLVLADLLDKAAPGETLLVVSLADGADAFLIRTTEALPAYRESRPSLRESLAEPLAVGYPTYLLWRGRLEREKPRRPDPVRPSAPFAARNTAFKHGFVGGRCRSCGTVQFPLPRICLHCGAQDVFDEVRAAGGRGTVVTLTVDHLAFTPSPPLVSAVLDLEVGGRVQIELTDVDPAAVAVGDTVQLTFRRLVTTEGIHNYFWKARPWRSTR